jgi:hypothetical protein
MKKSEYNYTNWLTWKKGIEASAIGFHDRGLVAVLMICGWVVAFVMIALLEFFAPMNIFLVVLLAIFTSEGFVSTTIQIVRWASNYGFKFIESSRKIIDSSKEIPVSARERLHSAVNQFEPTIRRQYNVFWLPNERETVDNLSKELAKICDFYNSK